MMPNTNDTITKEENAGKSVLETALPRCLSKPLHCLTDTHNAGLELPISSEGVKTS